MAELSEIAGSVADLFEIKLSPEQASGTVVLRGNIGSHELRYFLSDSHELLVFERYFLEADHLRADIVDKERYDAFRMMLIDDTPTLAYLTTDKVQSEISLDTSFQKMMGSLDVQSMKDLNLQKDGWFAYLIMQRLPNAEEAGGVVSVSLPISQEHMQRLPKFLDNYLR